MEYPQHLALCKAQYGPANLDAAVAIMVRCRQDFTDKCFADVPCEDWMEADDKYRSALSAIDCIQSVDFQY